MRDKQSRASTASHTAPSGKQQSGFSLVELMVAMAVFLVVGAAAVSLVKQHAPLVVSQQNQAGLNIGMRNAIAQMQIDVVNGGSGYYPGANMPDWPVGITTIQGAGGAGACPDANFVYAQTCFDTLRVLVADDTIPPGVPSSDSAGTVPVDLSTTDLYLTFPGATAAQLTTWAGQFQAGDQILLKEQRTTNPRMSTVVLTANGVVEGNAIHLQHAQTTTVQCGTNIASGIPTSDPLGIYDPAECASFTGTFSPGSVTTPADYVLKISPIIYSVDAVTNPASPSLVRQVGLNGIPGVITDQVIGFKISAWNTVTGDYRNNPADYNSNWTTIRAVRVNLIARTPPNPDPGYSFRNTLDGGPYKVQGVSVVINPRNLSM